MASEAFDFRGVPAPAFDGAVRNRRRLGALALFEGLSWRCTLTSNKAANGEYVGLYFRVPDDEVWFLNGVGHAIVTGGAASNLRYLRVASVYGTGYSVYGRELSPDGSVANVADIPDEAILVAANIPGPLYYTGSTASTNGKFDDTTGATTGRRRNIMFPGEDLLYRGECIATVVGTDWRLGDVWRPHLRVLRVYRPSEALLRDLVVAAMPSRYGAGANV